jgi:hypothetical protein
VGIKQQAAAQAGNNRGEEVESRGCILTTWGKKELKVENGEKFRWRIRGRGEDSAAMSGKCGRGVAILSSAFRVKAVRKASALCV